MSPVRRRSARLAGPGATPKPSSKAAMPQLSSLAEGDEAPPESTTESAVEQQQLEQQQKRSAKARARAAKKANPPPPAAQDLIEDLPPTPSHSKPTSLKPVPSTPVSSSPLKPPHSEMHPSKVQQTTQPLEPGLLLGFADIKTATHAASTPSKICPPPPAREPNSAKNGPAPVPPSSPFTFRFSSRPAEEAEGGQDGPEAGDRGQDGRRADMGLGEDALKIMQELRGKTAQIKEELVAQQEAADRVAAATLAAADGGRKIAKPKGRSGRFSAVHMAEFRKMDSIENHPSAFRAANSRFNSVTAASSTAANSTAANTSAMRRSPSKPNVGEPAAAAAQQQQQKPSLKRTQSKANLGDDNPDPAVAAAATTSTFSHPPSLSAIRRAMFRPNVGETASVPPSSSLTRTISKTSLHSKEAAPASCLPQPTMSRTQSKPNLGTGDHAAATTSAINISETPTSPSKISAPGRGGSTAAATPSVKRIKQRIGDDATTGRPTSSDGTSIPRLKPSGRDLDPRSPNRPRSNLVRFRESVLGRASARTAATGTAEPNMLRPVACSAGAEGSTSPNKVLSPGNFAEARATIRARLSEVKKMRDAELAKDAAMFAAGQEEKRLQSSIPVPSAAQTPGPTRIDRTALPSAPVTTPRRTFLQRLHFTPRTTQAALSQLHSSPTPVKVGPIRIETRDNISGSPAIGTRPGAVAAALKVSSITYPDLSKYKETSESPTKAEESKTESAAAAQPSVPGSFSFRADHTIEFDAGSRPAGFGPTRGQSSIRHVRDSIMSALKLPGSFPDSHPNKENRGPFQKVVVSADLALVDKTIEAAGIPHGIEHKKRARATWDDEESELEREQAGGPAKKHKSSHPSDGRDIFTTTPSKPAHDAHEPALSSSPIKNPTLTQTPTQPSAIKKKPFLSVSRLNMLAQPKNRR